MCMYRKRFNLKHSYLFIITYYYKYNPEYCIYFLDKQNDKL